MTPVSKQHPLHHYQWGSDCDAWNLVDGPNLSVKLERMPPGTSEERHYHPLAQQFFFVIEGKASFALEYGSLEVVAGAGLHLPPGIIHQISNRGSVDLEFLLCTEPALPNDRINCPLIQ